MGSLHSGASDGLTTPLMWFSCSRTVQLCRISCVFIRNACQKNLLMFLFW